MSQATAPSHGALGDRVRNLRDVRGWSPDELAARSGLELVDVLAIEQGDRDPTIGVLEVLARSLGVTISEMASGTERL